MKTLRSSLWLSNLILFALVIIALTGCASTTPTAFEQKFFDINTNYVPRVVVVTNYIEVERTNVAHVTFTNVIDVVSQKVVPVLVTNYESVPIWETNVVTQTNLVAAHTYTPNTNAAAIAGIGKAIGDPFGVGGLVGTLVAGLFAGWAAYRNRQNSTRATNAELSAAVLAQIIETGRNVLKTTPQGAELDAKFKSWMIEHQAATGVLEQVSGMLSQVVDNQSARMVAAELARLIQERKPTT